MRGAGVADLADLAQRLSSAHTLALLHRGPQQGGVETRPASTASPGDPAQRPNGNRVVKWHWKAHARPGSKLARYGLR